MKKIFFALAALAALASCAKVEAEYDQDVEIGFSPVVTNRTKAMQTTTDFPDETFNVWAWYKQLNSGTTILGWQASAESQQNYIVEKTFAKKESGNLWGGKESAYYWPKLGSLMFAGYYPSSIADQVSYTFTNEVNEMKIVNYVPGFVDAESENHEEDLMYFNMTPSSCRNANVVVTFRHALSWIDVVLVKDTETPEDAKITVNYVTFKDVVPFGNAVVNNSAVGVANEIKWTPHGDAKDVTVTEDTGHVINKDNETPLVKQPLFIPQPMTTLVVNYTIASEDESQFTETKEITLSTLISGHSSWKPGKKYTYTITIGTSEILIDPSVDEWDAVPVSIPIV